MNTILKKIHITQFCHTPVHIKSKLIMINKTLLFLAPMFISSIVFGNNDTIPHPTDSGVHFVSRNETINPENYFLDNSIRSSDKMDIDTSTIEIVSNGEGWLDKDSIPVGNWKFYANDSFGNTYILKEGNYVKSSPSMFKLFGAVDDLKELFGDIVDTILMRQVKMIPFIKTGIWSYYHSNGRLWKKVTFRSSEIPLEFDIAESNSSEQLLFLVNDDEPIEGKDEEFDKEGKLFKVLYYMDYKKIYKKISYDKNGNKTIKESFSESNKISSTNY